MPVTEYTWDPTTDSVLEETDGAGHVRMSYTNEPSQYGPLISQHRDGESHFFHFDALGSTRALTDENGEVTDTFAYDAWGNPMHRAGDVLTSLMWNGQYGYYSSADAMVYQVRRRAYSSNSASFLSIDPLIVFPRINQFIYTHNSPVTRFDPSGLLWEQQGTSSTWVAGADGDDLITLAMMVSTVERDWVCIWPIPDHVLWTDYPTAKKCAKADVSNLTQSPQSIKKARVALRQQSTDGYLRALGSVFGGSTFTWADGASAARWLKSSSGQGKTPIGTLWLGGHGNGTSEVLADRDGNFGFKPDDVLAIADEPNNLVNTYAHAIEKIGPPRCWLTRNSKVYLAGCWTSYNPLDGWVTKIARTTSVVHGASEQIFGLFGGQRRNTYVYFEEFPEDHYYNIGQFGGSPHWVTRHGGE